MRALVYGLARSGLAVVERLAERGDEAVAVDRSLGNEDDPSLLEGVDVLVKSPGVPGEAPLVRAARERGVQVWSEVEFAWRLLPDGTRLIGVTGTNGKTTTAELLGAIFRAAGREVAVAGNVGTPLSSVRDAEWVVCELSSFQLEDVETLRPRVAVLTNLEPDHLDRHGSFEAYADAKLRIFVRQGPGDVAVVPRGFGPVPGAARRIEFSAADALPAEPRIPGTHNRENAAAATAAALAIGVPDEAVARALERFPGVEHRIEEVGAVGGVLYVNDSKATNAAAAIRALASFPGRRKHVILGGRGKDEPYAALADALAPGDRAYLIGEATPPLAAALADAGVPYVVSETLERAVADAAGAASASEVVLLSPACASFDQFESFEHRGEEFRRLVQKLPGWGTEDVRTGARSSSDC